ncbi:UvrD-helicase domain-containing protein [Pseudoalteromonas lipolytica]|uniref:UvrD-helicase domain-containing protein n=1 Tax=Pseudoalteromonas lipolytica TaxID=570156 RepID=UPI0008247EA2|nr:UvrD-helicase domain-containing protein [Pseudoalteromonas lipolytica]
MEYIRINWLGRLLCKGNKLRFDEPHLTLLNGSTVLDEYNLHDSYNFPIFEKGLLGSKITLNSRQSKKTISFLKTKDIDKFYESLFRQIAFYIQQNIEGSKEQFYDYAINEYLRDSNIKKLDNLINPLLRSYELQKNEWNNNLPKNLIQFLVSYSKYFPLEIGASELRKCFEEVTSQERKKFYDEVESNPLTKEQRLAVIRDNDRNLVLAAAGTGKTSVMVAKALDLIDRKIAAPEKILILAYNKAAASELQERLKKRSTKLGLSQDKSPKIMTFHALGRQILLRSNKSVRMSKFCEDSIKLENWLSRWFSVQIKQNEKFMKTFIDLSYQPINPFDFKTKEDYDAYIRDNEYRTLQGDKVRGYQELLISNWLYLNGIEFEYEAQYVSKRRIEIGFDYKPDFYIKDADVYLEHFGIARDGSTRPDIDKNKYKQSMCNKRNLHLECGTTLIETYHYNWVEGNLEEILAEHIDNLGIPIKKRSNDEVFVKLKESGFLLSGIKRYLKCLQAIRVEQLSDAEINERLTEQAIVNSDKYTELLSSIHQAYQRELLEQDAIDFDDMIIKATKVVDNELFTPKWSHILVDEFQDISGSRMNFLKKLVSKGSTPRLTVVGDDWQSIYRFSGGKLELTTQFKERVGSCSSTMLQKTFRYNNSIAEVAGKFVMQNPEQYKKDVITHTQVDTSQVFLLDSKVNNEENLSLKTVQIIQKILKNDPQANIAVIARYRYLLNEAKNEVFANNIDTPIKFWTFHGSKGLEADYCVLIGFFQGKTGFPNQNKEEAIIEALLPSMDNYPHSEERRLLYVGLTRAKKKSYLIADPMATSEFIVELLSPKYNLHIASQSFEEKYRQIFKCPCCTTGYFKLKKGKFGTFYSCTTGEVCKSHPRICSKCNAPSIDGEHSSTCTNPNCKSVTKICNKCGRPMKLRQGKFGEFWGCTGYGIKHDQCKNTSKTSSFLGVKFD